VQEVNLKEAYVVFRKVRDLPRRKGRKRKLEITQPFTPVPVHVPRSKVPSKTKVSKLYARIKNLERQRMMGRQSIRGFKPKSNYQMRLFKNSKKPK
jgi:hypothetical protein